ncbi:hypothetical protein [Pelagerythrobacter sp.]|uniref:hypothetical protein n=1 Tax=Pelagerythrobacter sp. TaxID=2800702 RepID=UPI0035B49DDE
MLKLYSMPTLTAADDVNFYGAPFVSFIQARPPTSLLAAGNVSLTDSAPISLRSSPSSLLRQARSYWVSLDARV